MDQGPASLFIAGARGRAGSYAQTQLLGLGLFPPLFSYFLILLSVCLFVWITSYSPIGLFLENITTGPCLFSVDLYCCP